MTDPQVTQLLRDASASLCMDWCTTAPFQIGDLQVERIGFASIPMVYVMVHCHPQAMSSLVPVVRQVVFRELAAAGLENEILEFVPGVQEQGRGQRRFVDCNERSPTKGKNKMGRQYRFSFEIKRPFLGFFEWNGHYGRIPEKCGPTTK